MANAAVTIEQFKDVLKRLERLEYREVNIDEIKKEYHEIKKNVAVSDTKIDALDEKIDFKFDALRTELRITLGAILAVLVTIGIKLIFYS